ncbi:helix-turn-helix domain-containing protein [Bacillus chungangensis]|uniref:Transcriptional regulator with XRE-family HTH domain n=1 Tax=Bacillus chungangensis TaxID=587633 RepID=A0ABT9WQ67_9BACI|nr:helix-turn-helix transcriptional regulator [Bacillus chungangensis]MDQ0175379.1 transcriptional regulator with XRE-family HTH domain [Bacillus chungangensis]
MESFGMRLAKLREESGLSKKEISMKLGFTANVFGTYEREERRPTLETLVKMADFFHVSLDYLIRGQEYQYQNNAFNNDIHSLVIRELMDKGIKPYFLQDEKWKLLSEADIQELENHFEWVVKKAEMRADKKKNEDKSS